MREQEIGSSDAGAVEFVRLSDEVEKSNAFEVSLLPPLTYAPYVPALHALYALYALCAVYLSPLCTVYLSPPCAVYLFPLYPLCVLSVLCAVCALCAVMRRMCPCGLLKKPLGGGGQGHRGEADDVLKYQQQLADSGDARAQAWLGHRSVSLVLVVVLAFGFRCGFGVGFGFWGLGLGLVLFLALGLV